MAREVDPLMPQDRIVHRAPQTRLERAVQRGQPDHSLVLSTAHVDVERQADLTFRERPRLVAAEDVHAAEVLDGGEPLDDDLLPRHADGAGGERDGDDHGQELGRQPDRQRHREQERFQRIAAQERVDQEDEEHEEQDDL
jgi:hypothetical protein